LEQLSKVGLTWTAKVEAIIASKPEIMIDLNGMTGLSSAIGLATSPSPIALHWHGYPGTTGVRDLVTHFVGDPVSSPPVTQERFAEKLALLPRPYLFLDYTERPITGCDNVTKASLGIPDGPFVFASFNGWFKIHPALFLSWMSVMKQAPDSVLWLLQWSEESSMEKFKEMAEEQGVDRKRIVFTKKLSVETELCVKGRFVDLFLDSPLLNGHTTASDMVRNFLIFF
jgi:protein O-GlcNAc transferase